MPRFTLDGKNKKKTIIVCCVLVIFISLVFLTYNIFIFNNNYYLNKIERIEYHGTLFATEGDRKYINITDESIITDIINPYKDITFYLYLWPTSFFANPLIQYNDKEDEWFMVLSPQQSYFIGTEKSAYRAVKKDLKKVESAINNAENIGNALWESGDYEIITR